MGVFEVLVGNLGRWRQGLVNSVVSILNKQSNADCVGVGNAVELDFIGLRIWLQLGWLVGLRKLYPGDVQCACAAPMQVVFWSSTAGLFADCGVYICLPRTVNYR